MAICFVQNTYPPYAQGGAETIVRLRAEAALSRGERAIVITLCPWEVVRSLTPQKSEEWGITIYRVWAFNLGSYFSLPRHGTIWRLAWHIIDILNSWTAAYVESIWQNEKVTHVESHNVMGLGYGVMRQAAQHGRTHTHVFHDVQAVNPSGMIPATQTTDSFFEHVYAGIMKRSMGAPSIVITGSQFLQIFYTSRGFFPKALWKVERPIVPPGQTAHTYSGGPVHYLFLGTVASYKGVDVLLRAFEDVLPEQGVLHVAGVGALEEQVRLWAKKKTNIIFHGRVEAEEKENLFRSVQVVVVPSVCIENTPTVILEAAAHGLPVIATRSGGIPELVPAVVNGTVVAPDNVEELQNAIVAFQKKILKM